jgi:acyl-CoA thioesterase II
MLEALAFDNGAPGRLRAQHVVGLGDGPNAFGGALLAQMVAAADRSLGNLPLTSLHAVFGRAVRRDQPLDVEVDTLHFGRSAGTATITMCQGDIRCVGAVAVGLADQGDLPRHGAVAPEVGGPDAASPLPAALPDTEMRVVGDVDFADPGGGFPPEILVWVWVPGAPDDTTVAKAMIAYASEAYFVATALRPHAGMSQASLFTELTPAVVSHGLAFHDHSVRVSDWLLYAFTSPHLAAGRVFGRGDVFTSDGRLVASVVQENLLRPVKGSTYA